MGSPSDQVRELRAQLKNARNDVTRYASQIRCLELQLAKERSEAFTTARSQESALDPRTDEAIEASDAWTKVVADAERTLRQCTCSRGGGDQSVSPSSQLNGTKLDNLLRFIKQQRQMVVELGQENSKLRDQLDARPTRNQLVVSSAVCHVLQSLIPSHSLALSHTDAHPNFVQIQELRSKSHKKSGPQPTGAGDTSGTAPPTEPVLEPLPSHTLSECISMDKLLSWLHVETRSVAASSRQQARMQRAFLKDTSVQCYLVLDPAALAAGAYQKGSGKENASSSLNQKSGELSQQQLQLQLQQKRRYELERKVGRVCSELVAICCHVLQVKHVGKLPQAVQTASRLAGIVPTFQQFLSKLQTVLHRLHEILEQVEDVVVELEARRKQMQQTPGTSTFDALFELMTLLQVTQVDQMQPIILRLIKSGRNEKLFVIKLRELLGLPQTATQRDIVDVISAFMKQLKLIKPHSKRPANTNSTKPV